MEHVFSLTITLGALIAFLSGSIPFSVWLGYYFAHKDIRRYGDGNPGAVNAWRAAGWRIGLTAVLLDYLKGAVPVAVARYGIGINDWGIVPIAIAPIVGHAFSPFLRFRGGKAVAVTMGVWSGLTLWEAPTVLGIALTLAVALNATDAWSVVFGMSVLLIYLLLWGTLSLVIVWLANFAIILWKHRFSLRTPPRPRVWLEHLF